MGAINFFQSMDAVAKNLLTDVSDLVFERLNLEINAAERFANLSKHLIESGQLKNQNIPDYTFYVAKNLPYYKLPYAARIVGWGDAQGNSVETSRQADGSYSTRIIKPSSNPPVHFNYFRDLNGKIIRSETVPGNYDPRRRPWYITAQNAKKFVWTDYFLSYPYKNPSMAAVVPTYNQFGQLLGVFEIEIKLVGISNFLASLDIGKDGTAFIINSKEDLVAFPRMEKKMGEVAESTKLETLEKDRPWLIAALSEYNKSHQDKFVFEYAGIRYLVHFKEIPQFAAFGWKIGVVVPESSFVGHLEKRYIYITLLGIGILLLGLLIASFFSKRISDPLKLLVGETERIKNFHLEGGKLGNSIITEVDALANAIYSMKVNLRSFQKYIPAVLVRQLIQSGQDIELGGEKKVLTVFFSDIKGFTTIAESSDPEQLVIHLEEYLDEMSKIIIDENGTIDKYIGDSIMAFWNAPLPDIKHCLHACSAALKCKNRLSELNTLWEQQGKPVFISRFGIHMGEVIIGNIGSSERLNYTAIGDNINLASRLEQLSKVYGTVIIVSEIVVNEVGDNFVFRMLDRIKVRGKTGTYIIYELLAESNDQLNFDLNSYRTYFDKGFDAYQRQHWQEAIDNYNQCLIIYPDDSVARVFINRCQDFMHNPPPRDWDGVWG